ncbi:coiled-coil domain-containing protein 84 [Callorhinchus milii]|uniref:coiled-coil domain-containing protein 84 n=1 Tax=Callorhinchus milii TaxID=7868 RepID=UPI001C3F8010|nr:coiled-coil domain-containing protein 84 [Callorhinchus milii]
MWRQTQGRAMGKQKAAFHCELCRRTFFSGRGHVYGLKHQETLRNILDNFLEKVRDARKVLKEARVERYDFTEHDQNFWCYCCKTEVKKHVTNGNIAVVYGGFLEHFESSEHKKKTSAFWWENKANIKLKDQFSLSPEDYEKFKAAVTKALESYEEKEDEYIKEGAERIREVEQQRRELVQAALEPQAEQSLDIGASEPGVSHQSHLSAYSSEEPGPSGLHFPFHSDDLKGQKLTFLGDKLPGFTTEKGNVHTGATPPWLIDDEEETGTAIGPSYEEFIQQKEKEKLRKLPPNRVGANFNHTSETDDSWLPSFGRVWNDGRRWQSRKQFRLEEGKKATRKRKRNDQNE